ncbi:S-layer homology domain-containing protein [Paenibacillus sp. GCM10027627]|uniref:S-layer homology domain-containing protein n=1 Tax=unclassified Paenibacillus TaxID=185978 RepID=UPI00363C63A6
MKRALALLLTFALIIGILPSYMAPQKADAAGSYFLFPNEHDTIASARIVSTPTIGLQGTINGVNGASISYNVKQVTSSGAVLNTTQEISTGISTTNDNKINVSGIILFPGINKITFKGIAGTSEVSESIYVEYRNSPMLYDLKVNFENREYDMQESGPTMLYSTNTQVQNQGTIVITGKAPNATKVTVLINGRSYDFNVSSSSSDSRFSTSQLTIDKGMNNITFKVYNNGQIIETTREVAYYNGEVTFYNLNITDSAASPKSAKLENNVDFLTGSNAAGYVKLKGSAIVPLPIRTLNDSNTNNQQTIVQPSDPAFPGTLAGLLSLEAQINGGAAVTIPVNSGSVTYSIDSSNKFVTVNFTYDLPAFTFDASNRVRFKAPNDKVFGFSNWYSFTIRNSSLSYIYDINYLSGFDNSMVTPSTNSSQVLGLQGMDIPADGVNVYSMPMAVEVLIGNYTAITGGNNDLFKVNGKAQADTGSNFRQVQGPGTGTQPSLTEVVYLTINNESVPFLRTFIVLDQLPRTGTNEITFQLNRGGSVASQETKKAIAKLLYGPHAKFDSLVDGMKVEFDTVRGNSDNLLSSLGNLAGQLLNVTNTNDIRYENTTVSGSTLNQSVFLYLNNVEIPLEQNGTITKFKPKDIDSTNATDKAAARNRIVNVLNKAGDNTIKIVFRSGNNVYENTMKFSIVPTNLPVIPAPNTDGVYPYSSGANKPLPNDPNFVKQGTIFTTKEASYNVYGTFDFVDLGTDTSFTAGHGSLQDKNNYIVSISSPNWKTSVKWDLSKEFWPMKDGAPLAGYETTPFNRQSTGSNPSTQDATVVFQYDVTNQNFSFIIKNQSMPIDGSSQVYVITVFNAGEAGPRATYRLEINPVSIPYTIKSPLAEERIMNQNFVEVIITSPGADTIIIGKTQAEPVKFIEYVGGIATYIDAFKAVVKDLRENRETKIPFTITRGEDTIKQELTVKYVPATIPGAQKLETMKSSHKMYDNVLQLDFARGTQLVRPNYNSSNNQSTQVYNGNDILFAVANPNDGIINRHMFESQPPNYSANSQAEGNLHIGYRFQDLARQYIKASPLFWIDAGLADNPDPSSPQFDPIKSGLDPFPFPNVAGKYLDSFAKRWNQFDRQLVPSKPGELTLTYDANVAEAAGTTITVFRFDPYNSTWENIGGVVDQKKRTITVPFTKFGYYVAAKMTRGFNDITDHPYAREAMEAIYAKGVMNAVDPVGVFGADRFVTRGEFSRMIVRALDLPLNYGGDLHFTYYPETITNANNANAIYDYRYIETAARAGIVRGTRPGFFDEDVELSRQDASVMLARALDLKMETDGVKAKKALDKIFKDSGSFDHYSIPAILAIEKKKFIQGQLINPTNPKEGSVFLPKARLLRSDAAIIMGRVMNDMKKLPPIYN